MLDRIIISQLNNKHAQLWWVIISECSFWNTKLSWGSSRSRRDCFYLSDFRKKWNAKENGIQRRQQQTYFPICSKRLQSQNYFINSAIKKEYSGRRRNFVLLSLSLNYWNFHLLTKILQPKWRLLFESNLKNELDIFLWWNIFFLILFEKGHLKTPTLITNFRWGGLLCIQGGGRGQTSYVEGVWDRQKRTSITCFFCTNQKIGLHWHRPKSQEKRENNYLYTNDRNTRARFPPIYLLDNLGKIMTKIDRPHL